MTAVTNGPVCGNCGKPVAADAITCAHCGVLLAAYQATGGSESLTIVIPDSPVDDISSPATGTPPPAAPSPTPPGPGPAPRPVSSSPIGDALRRSRNETDAELRHETSLSDLASDELAAMASGNDDLADMADGDDDLAAMASGNDELSAMAGGGQTGSFEEAVNAELAGARVVFAGDKPVIEGAEVEVIEPGEGEPDVIEQLVASPMDEGAAGSAAVPEGEPVSGNTTQPSAGATSPAPDRTGTQRPSPAERGRAREQATTQSQVRSGNQASGANPSRVPAAPSWQSIPGGKRQSWPQDLPKPDLSKTVGPLMAIPFLLIVCLILGAGRGVGTFLLISFITMVIIIFLLVRAAQMATRKTTSMPRDKKK